MHTAVVEVEQSDERDSRSTQDVLGEYGLPEHAPVEQLEALIRVAAALCGTASAVVNLLDGCFQHQVGAVGLQAGRSDVGDSMCAVSLGCPELRYTPDASLETGFRHNPWVDGRRAAVRLYASAPLLLPDGRVLGTLCVFDVVPGTIDQVRRAALADLAAQAVVLIEHAREARAAQAQALLFRIVAESPSDVLSWHRADGVVLWVSPSVRSVLGRDPASLVGRRSDVVHPDDRLLLEGVLDDVLAGVARQVTVRQQHADGSWRWMEQLLSPMTGQDGDLQVHCVTRDVTGRVEAEAALRETAAQLEVARDEALRRGALLEAVLDTIGVGVVACDADGHLTMFNRASREFHGLVEDPTLDPSQWTDRYALFDADGTTPLAPERIPLVRALADGRISEADIVIAPAGRPAHLVRCDGRALRDDDGRLLGAVVAQRDETAARAAVGALRASEQRFRAAFSDGPAPMAHLDGDGRLVDVNAALRRFVSHTSGRLVGRQLAELVLDADAARLQRALDGGGTRAEPVEVRVVRSDGTAVWCELACSRTTGADGVDHLLVQLVDVHARKLSELALQRAARQDPLTGASNREGLSDRLAELLDPASPDASPVALLFVDLDHFKRVNDEAGHEAGDLVLQAVAGRLRAAVRPGDCVARLGGDEFVVVVTGRAVAAVEQLRDRLPSLLAAPILVAGISHRVGASVGLAHGRVGDHPAAVLARADAAMYAHKRRRAGLTQTSPRTLPVQGSRVPLSP
ncbi:MAG: hypothetical protein JWN08_1388 [Frankiales bacterium]|nr:hypothetical protein [Frankiales bacterium]